MSREELTDIQKRITTYICAYGVPINIRHGTNLDVAAWLSNIIETAGKGLVYEKNKNGD